MKLTADNIKSLAALISQKGSCLHPVHVLCRNCPIKKPNYTCFNENTNIDTAAEMLSSVSDEDIFNALL